MGADAGGGPPEPGRPPWRALLVVCSILALHNVMRTGPVTLVEELRARYAADYAAVGNVIGAYTLTYGVAQLAAGVLSDRLGSRRLMLLGLGLAAAGSAAFAVAPSYPLAVAARLVMGLAGGCLYTPTLAYAFAAFPPALRGRVMGLAESGVGAGQILAVTALPALFGAVGLTPAFLSVPLAALGLGVAVALGLPPARAGRRPSAGSARALVESRDFWLLLVGFAFVGMLAQVAVLAWIPTYLRQVHGFGVMAAGWSTAVVLGGLMVFSPLFGLVSDRLRARRPVMLAGAALGLAGFLLLLGARHPAVAVGAALLVSASMAATIPAQVVFASERFAAVGAATAIGLVNAGGQLAASLGGPLYGLLLDRGLGFGAVWGTAVGLGVVRILAVLGLRERGPGATGRP
jgi:predicted MFS family arabinose efflux permease